MGVLDQIVTTQSNVRSINGRSGQTDKPKAKVWGNVGYELNGKFISLPVGIPMDTMEVSKSNSNNKEWVAFQDACNTLLKHLQSMGDEMEPGQDVVIPNLEFRLHRVKEAVVVEAEDNDFRTDLSQLFAGAKVITPPEPKAE